MIFEEHADEAGRGAGRRRSSARPRVAQPEVHLRQLRRRLLEPVRPRGRARGGRDPLEVLQPALHLRRRGARQDAPDARDRPLHPGAREEAEPRLHLDRPLHQRDDQRDPLRPPARVPLEVPRDRRAADRRHPVHRRQGPHPGGVLPHLQRAPRRPEADRGELRLPAAPDPDDRGAAAQPLRVGPDRRHPGAGHRDQDRDPAQEGRGRARVPARERRALHREQGEDQHPRARGQPDPADRLRQPHRPRHRPAARAGDAAGTCCTPRRSRSRSR